MHGVFVSHAREEQGFARSEYHTLLATGRVPTWDKDHRTVSFGARRSETRAAIKNSVKFVLVIPPGLLDSLPERTGARDCEAAIGWAVPPARAHRQPSGGNAFT
jgi:hypothetical protein